MQNLVWAAGYNILAIPIAAAGALNWAGISLPPAGAAVLMSVSTIIVLDAQLLRRLNLQPPPTLEPASKE